MDKDYREDEGFIRYQNNLDERSRRNMNRQMGRKKDDRLSA